MGFDITYPLKDTKSNDFSPGFSLRGPPWFVLWFPKLLGLLP